MVRDRGPGTPRSTALALSIPRAVRLHFQRWPHSDSRLYKRASRAGDRSPLTLENMGRGQGLDAVSIAGVTEDRWGDQRARACCPCAALHLGSPWDLASSQSSKSHETRTNRQSSSGEAGLSEKPLCHLADPEARAHPRLSHRAVHGPPPPNSPLPRQRQHKRKRTRSLCLAKSQTRG